MRAKRRKMDADALREREEQRRQKWQAEGADLRSLRVSLGLTQDEAARRLALYSRSWLCDIEAGRRGIPWYCGPEILVMRDEVARLRPALLPDEPPPQGGHGDVLADLAELIEAQDQLFHSPNPPKTHIERRALLHEIHMRTLQNLRAYRALLGCDLRAEIMDRRRIGVETYGLELRYEDGRGIVDAFHESLDEAAYQRRELGPPEGRG